MRGWRHPPGEHPGPGACPILGPKEYTATGWFGQTDVTLCQRHVDADADQREDSVYITVWKTWDFYLAAEQVPQRQGFASLPARLAAALGGRPLPTTPRLTLLHRAYAASEPAPWQLLDAAAHPEAWRACEEAWRGVLDDVRKGVAQHRAHYPLYQHLLAELRPERIAAFTTLPVIAERCTDWWDSEHNGWWEGCVWVGAREPCMHAGEPWGRAVKLSWRNGTEAPGDAEDDAHGIYQIDVDEARSGPPLVAISYAQRQSAPREPLPRAAADHIARLLDFFTQLENRLAAADSNCAPP